MIVPSPITPTAGKAWVGDWKGSSAVAIGRRWIICASHQDGTTSPTDFTDPLDRFIMNGVTYSPVRRYRHDLDCLIIEIASDLAGWHRLGAGVSIGTSILLAGRGRFATVIPGSVADGSPDWIYDGVKWASNTVEAASTATLVSHAYAFSLKAGGASNEGIPATNDSGGGVFTVEGGSGDYLYQGTIVGGATDAYAVGAQGSANAVERLLPFINLVTRPRVSLGVAGGIVGLRAERLT